MLSKQQEAMWAESLNLQPVLRLPDFLREHKTPLPAAEEMRELHVCLEEWTKELVCLHLNFTAGEGGQRDEQGLLLVYLPEAVEQYIAEVWQRSPAQGHLLHNLAQQLCREAAALALPKIGLSGCAPLPRLTCAETNLLREFVSESELGKGAKNKFLSSATGIGRVYSILTYYPYAHDCARCALSGCCPKLRYC